MSQKIFVLILSMVGVGSAVAHHSVAVNFDQSSTITVEGRLTAIAWRNPHSHMTLVARDASDSEWLVEFGAINTMTRSGFEIDRFRVGDSISITGWPGHRDRTIFFQEATLEGGATLVCAGASCGPSR